MAGAPGAVQAATQSVGHNHRQPVERNDLHPSGCEGGFAVPASGPNGSPGDFPTAEGLHYIIENINEDNSCDGPVHGRFTSLQRNVVLILLQFN